MKKQWILGISSVATLAVILVTVGRRGAWAEVLVAHAVESTYAPAATRVVTSAADSGYGTLRWALQAVVAGDTITFDPAVFPPGSPVTIALSSALPDIITDNVTIDGSSSGVILDGSGTPRETNGLVIDGAGSVTIKGLQILNFPNDGIELRNGASNDVIGGSNATPGGACTGDCNLISGNGSGVGNAGVWIQGSGTTSNTVSGNYIGTDAFGTSALGNNWDGVGIVNGASNNTVGGTTAAERNIISGNNGPGVSIVGQGTGTMGNVVRGNYIGADVKGISALGNCTAGDYTGVAVYYSPDNTIENNLISGNNGSGAVIQGDSSTANVVRGNYIGTDASGTMAVSNTNAGVSIRIGAQHNVIGGNNATPGGNCTGECNLISGNGSGIGNAGVWIQDGGTMSNTVSGNYIGTTVSGTSALGNNWDGVFIGNGASNNTVGGTTAAERNIISGNDRVGVSINGQGSGTTGNVVRGNYIGTDRDGTSTLGNGVVDAYTGVEIYHSPGDIVEDNLISGNNGNGVVIQGDTSMGNTVVGNYIGTDISGTGALGNAFEGIFIADSASDNIIGGSTVTEGNIIAYNGRHGIGVYDLDSLRNTVTHNSVHDNDGMGIELDNGGNTELAAPTITRLDLGAGTVMGTACANCTVEIFSDSSDEGEIYEGQTVADGTGAFTFNKGASFAGPHLTTTATDAEGNTSEFSRYKIYLPIILRQ